MPKPPHDQRGHGGNRQWTPSKPAAQHKSAPSKPRVPAIPKVKTAPKLRTMWEQMWSWGVVGTVAVFVLGGGIAFMTSAHPYAADVFFLAGTSLLLAKFWTWEETKRQPATKKKTFLIYGTAISVLLLSAAVGWNHWINWKTTGISGGELEEMHQLDELLAGKAENDLRTFFGFQEMVATNIALYKAWRINNRDMKKPTVPLLPDSLGGRELQYDRQWSPENITPTESGYSVNLDPNAVSLLVLPVIYSANKKQLLRFENSSLLPLETTYAVKELDRAVQANVDRLQAVLNIAMKENPDYFILHDTPGSKFAFAIEGRYYSQFEQLRPLADKIRDTMREAIKHQ
jgi:hypothetical protein